MNMKSMNFLIVFIISVLTVHLSVYAANVEIAEYEQDIERSCIRLKINTSGEYEYISAIACRIPINSDMSVNDIADVMVAAAQINTTDSVSVAELYYDEKNIKLDKLYIYVSADGDEAEPLVISFKTRDKSIIYSFKTASVWNVYEELIEKYKTAFNMFSLDTSSYTKLSGLNAISRADIYKNMYKERSGFNTVSDIEQSYISAIDSVYNASQKSYSGGGSSGGGGSSPNPVTPSVAAQTPVHTAAVTDPIMSGFTDMEGYDWAVEAVTALKDKSIVEGISEEKFNPGGIITREDFVKIFVSAVGYDLSNGKSFFNDIVEGAYYEKYVNTAYDKGIINGISDLEFGIGMPITRQDIAVILYRAAFGNKIETGKTYNFTDHDRISTYAKEAVSDLAAEGIISGMDDGSFRPMEYASRAQAAQMIYKLLLSGRI